mmetsp:Transcript_31317/g.88812  ORF Transcript_31317/g.88812 Transcript_31317/m.88812 type:complete len:595 (+) Transcript_31317:70-1854(+)
MPAAVRGEGAEALPWGLLLLSFVATAFGNSLEPISALAALQPALLLHLYRRLEEGRQRAATGPGTGAQAQCAARRGRRLLSLVLVAPTQALAWTVAFAGLFKIGGWSAPGLATVLAISLLLWLPLAVVVLQAAVAFRERFPASPGRLFVFPCLWTAVYTVVSATPLSSMTNPAYGLLDHRPFALLASLLGVHGLNFMLALACAAAEDAFHLHCSSSSTAGSRPEQRQIPALHGQKTSVALALLALLIYGGAWGHIDTFYQRDVEATAAPAELSASCILGSPAGGGDLAWQLQQTAERVAAGDDIILWSEAAVAVASPEEEEDLLARASALQLQQQQEEEESSSSGNSSSSNSSSMSIKSAEEELASSQRPGVPTAVPTNADKKEDGAPASLQSPATSVCAAPFTPDTAEQSSQRRLQSREVGSSVPSNKGGSPPPPEIDEASVDALWADALRAAAERDAQAKRKHSGTVEDRQTSKKKAAAAGRQQEVAAGMRGSNGSPGLGREVRSGRPTALDLRGTQDPFLLLLRTFHSHREGVVDTTAQVLAALQSSEFPAGSMEWWAADLLRAARAARKHTMAKALQGLVPAAVAAAASD